MAFLKFNIVFLCGFARSFKVGQFVKVNAGILFYGVGHGDARKGLAEVDFVTVKHNRGAAVDLFGAAAEHLLGDVHHAVKVCVCLIKLKQGKFRVVAGVHPLVAEYASDFVNSVKAADNKPLEVKLQRNTHIHINVQRIVVGDKGARRSAARNGVEHWGFNLKEVFLIKQGADFLDNHAALYKGILNLRVHNKVNIALTVAKLRVFKSVEFFRQGKEGLCKQHNGSGAHGNFTHVGAEHNAGNADDVANVPFFEVGIGFLANHVLADIKLNATLFILKVGKACLAHAALAHNAACHRNGYGTFFTLRRVYKVCFDIAGICGDVVFCNFKGVFACFAQRFKLVAANL